jgi:hypothetical protein
MPQIMTDGILERVFSKITILYKTYFDFSVAASLVY